MSTVRRHYGRRWYVADGFVDDCEELIQKCLRASSVEPLNYETFCVIFKEMNFTDIFKGRPSGAELAELSEEVILIAKHYMLGNNSSYEESVAGLFLVYALVNLQPYSGFASLRIVHEDVQPLKHLEFIARRDRRIDVLYVLGSLLIKGPTQYHASQRERGLERGLNKYFEGLNKIDLITSRPRGVFYRQTEELDLIKELSDLNLKYMEAKRAVMDNKSDPSLNYVDNNLVTYLETSLEKLAAGRINQKEETDEPSTSTSPRLSNIQAIKHKAMTNQVDQMNHLVGINGRKRSPTKKRENIAKAGKVKTGSPVKPLTTSSPKKGKKRNKVQNRSRFKGKRKKISKEVVSDSDVSESDLNLTDASEDNEINNSFTNNENNCKNNEVGNVNNEGDELNLNNFHKEIEPSNNINTATEIQCEKLNLEIAVPNLTNNEDAQQCSIEIIDLMDKNGIKSRLKKSLNFTESKNKLLAREYKKAAVKSKLKRKPIHPMEELTESNKS